MDYKEYDREELEVGMTVAVPREVHFGWGSIYRHSIWVEKTIDRLTPAKMSVRFTDGTKKLVVKRGARYDTGLYKPDEAMTIETKTAICFQKAYKSLGKISNLNLFNLSDEDLFYVSARLSEIVERVQPDD